MRAVAAGSYHTCALAAAGAVFCWGWNVGGQVGDGLIANRLSPFEVPGLTNIAALAMGSYHSCALLDDGVSAAGDRTTTASSATGPQQNSGTPVGVFSLPPSTAIAAGGRHSCARLADATVQCWGGNDVGELGDGTTMAHSFPEPVDGRRRRDRGRGRLQPQLRVARGWRG